MEGEVKRPPEGLDPTGGILDYDSASEPDMVMAHVLFMDVVRYSSYAMDEQAQLLTKLNKIVRSTPEFSRAEAASTLRPLPTGDGMALAFLGSLEEAVRCAIAVSRALQEHPDLELRMGIHTGGVLNAKDITGKDNIAGPGINLAQRVMDCGDAGHILVSGYVAETLSQLTRWRDMLHELGETTVKNTKVRVFNFHGPAFGNPEVPSRFRIPEGSAKTRKKVAILYKRNAQPDEYVLKVLEKELAAAGHDVFIDRHLKVGSEWANVIEEHVRLADAVVVLVSTHSILSEMMAFELGTARQAAERAPNERRGLPRILPVRVAYEGYLPDEINAIIGKLQYVLWHGPQDDELLVKELHRAISSIGEAFDP